PGSVASDGTGRNGLFTSKLLQHLNTAGLNIEQVFKQVAKDVAAASNDEQRPWIASDYTGDFYFTPGAVPEKPLAATNETLKTAAPATERTVAMKKSLPDDQIDFGYGPGETSVVNIGDQSWAVSNLNLDQFSNGDLIPEAKTESEWKFAATNHMPAWCHFLNKKNYGERYGKLYNFYAVSDKRGLCPVGWHVPSDAEWAVLASQYKENIGTKLKSKDGWFDGIKGTNESGFNGLAAGYRFYYDGSFKGDGAAAVWWSTTEDDSGSVLGRSLFHKVSYMEASTYNKQAGMSVRCLKD
ncbi:MAG: FISUMP domain-containing protein, partial [Bacteroidota bacterium]